MLKMRAKIFFVMVQVILWYNQAISTPSESAVPVESPHARYKRVVGGQRGGINKKWPWLVYLEGRMNGDVKSCSGVLIKKRWVLTAAHCFGRVYPERRKDRLNLNPRRWKVMVGRDEAKLSYSMKFSLKGYVFSLKHVPPPRDRVLAIAVHPKYRSSLSGHDIALVKFSRKSLPKGIKILSPEHHVKPVPLPDLRQRVYKVGQKCFAQGWGSNSDEGRAKYSRRVSRAEWASAVELPVYPTWKCRRLYGPYFPSIIKPLCVGYRNRGMGIVSGDSGGPLVCMSRGRYTLAGIASFGRRHDPSNFPSIFTRVQSYLPWIYSVIRKGRRGHAEDPTTTKPKFAKLKWRIRNPEYRIRY